MPCPPRRRRSSSARRVRCSASRSSSPSCARSWSGSAAADVAPRRLALFPLPVVLFPGTTMPLHIFEPRYRELIADCRRTGGGFGLILTTGGDERALPAGHVGCAAELREVETLPD